MGERNDAERAAIASWMEGSSRNSIGSAIVVIKVLDRLGARRITIAAAAAAAVVVVVVQKWVSIPGLR